MGHDVDCCYRKVFVDYNILYGDEGKEKNNE